MRNAGNVVNIQLHLNSFAHNLNIAPGKVREIREVENMLAKIRLVVGHLHRCCIAFGRTQC